MNGTTCRTSCTSDSECTGNRWCDDAGTCQARSKANLKKAAREAYSNAAIVDPRNIKAYHGLALCLVAEKQWAKAAAALRVPCIRTTRGML